MLENRRLRTDAMTRNFAGAHPYEAGQGTAASSAGSDTAVVRRMLAHHTKRHKVSRDWRTCPCPDCAIRRKTVE